MSSSQSFQMNQWIEQVREMIEKRQWIEACKHIRRQLKSPREIPLLIERSRAVTAIAQCKTLPTLLLPWFRAGAILSEGKREITKEEREDVLESGAVLGELCSTNTVLHAFYQCLIKKQMALYNYICCIRWLLQDVKLLDDRFLFQLLFLYTHIVKEQVFAINNQWTGPDKDLTEDIMKHIIGIQAKMIKNFNNLQFAETALQWELAINLSSDKTRFRSLSTLEEFRALTGSINLLTLSLFGIDLITFQRQKQYELEQKTSATPEMKLFLDDPEMARSMIHSLVRSGNRLLELLERTYASKEDLKDFNSLPQCIKKLPHEISAPFVPSWLYRVRGVRSSQEINALIAFNSLTGWLLRIFREAESKVFAEECKPFLEMYGKLLYRYHVFSLLDNINFDTPAIFMLDQTILSTYSHDMINGLRATLESSSPLLKLLTQREIPQCAVPLGNLQNKLIELGEVLQTPLTDVTRLICQNPQCVDTESFVSSALLFHTPMVSLPVEKYWFQDEVGNPVVLHATFAYQQERDSSKQLKMKIQGAMIKKCEECQLALYCCSICQDQHSSVHSPLCTKTKEAFTKWSNPFSNETK